ncbi:hypothetical protein AJ80_07395, partial [Polytolypa hystricis UAMH7299]
VTFIILYVAPFYLSPATRPSPTLTRDAPSVIKARIRAVTTSCIVCSTAVFCLIIYKGNLPPLEALRLLGWFPVSLLDVGKSLLLTALLFMGPVFERGIAEGGWRRWISAYEWTECLSGWIGWRNFVAGPITEEVIFRSVITPLHLMAEFSPSQIVFITPLYFGIAHVHHFYEFRLTNPHSLVPAILRSLFQFTYTTLFGWFATFVFLRTGSLPAVILVHAFCNYFGLPRLWGRVEAPVNVLENGLFRGKQAQNGGQVEEEYRPLGIGWSVVYYVLLVVGLYAFISGLWVLTESSYALAAFNHQTTS